MTWMPGGCKSENIKQKGLSGAYPGKLICSNRQLFLFLNLNDGRKITSSILSNICVLIPEEYRIGCYDKLKNTGKPFSNLNSVKIYKNQL